LTRGFMLGKKKGIMKLHKALLFLGFLIFFSPVLAIGAESEANQREKVISLLQTPRQISHLEWLFLHWEMELKDEIIKKNY